MQPDYIFETSWEVCNRVGGIYAVLSTRAASMQAEHPDHVFFFGPDFGDHSNIYFKEDKRLLKEWSAAVSRSSLNIPIRVGRWQVPGEPIAILLKFDALWPQKDAIYAWAWNKFQVQSHAAYGDYDESCMFGYAAGMVMETLYRWIIKNEKLKIKNSVQAPKVCMHANEWQTAFSIFYLRDHCPEIATLFTTHATSIGRSIAGNGKPLYDCFEGYHGDQMAQELNMQAKHSLEKAAAHAADAFTTVSEVTARECEQLLERRPLVTPNAFEQRFVPKGKDYDTARRNAREHLLHIVAALTGKCLPTDTMLIATSGRCEFRNKGIDLYLDALNVMRTLLHSSVESSRPVVAFVLVPSWVDCPRADLVDSMKSAQLTRLPNPVVTHQLHQPESDVVLCKMRDVNFNNQPDDRLMVIDVPCYLNGHDGIVGLSYYDVLPALDLTVFPSYYEPWGYTPLESIAFGVPTITTNLAGFGQWVLDNFGHDAAASGVTVLHRTDSNYGETVHALAAELMQHYHLTAADCRRRIQAARATSRQAQWKQFIAYYQAAYSF